MLNILFLDIFYFLTDLGGLCSDLGAKSVEDEKSCQAVSDLVEKIEVKTFFLKYDLHWYFPKGCYTTPLDGGIHFNPNPDGDRQPMARQICTPGNQTQWLNFTIALIILGISFLIHLMNCYFLRKTLFSSH